MRIIFTDKAWKEYKYWLLEDRRMLKTINALIKDIRTKPYVGLGKPEPLKFDLKRIWSRRINQEHRIVYNVREQDIKFYSCRYHYDNL